MSISLNNHESRIKALENKFLTGGFMTETVLFTGSSYSTITLSDSVENYDLIEIYIVIGTSGGDIKTISSEFFNMNLWGEYATSIGMSCINVSGTTIKWIDNWSGRNTSTVRKVVGLKWGGGVTT